VWQRERAHARARQRTGLSMCVEPERKKDTHAYARHSLYDIFWTFIVNGALNQTSSISLLLRFLVPGIIPFLGDVMLYKKERFRKRSWDDPGPTFFKRAKVIRWLS